MRKQQRSWEIYRRIVCLLAMLNCMVPAFAEEEVQVNFRDADIRNVIESVAEITGKSFVLDPRVKGKVTIVAPRPISRDLLYEAILSALQVQGFHAVDDGAVTRILPFNQSFKIAGASGKNQLETRLIKVNHVDVNRLVPVLKPLSSTGALLQGFADSNYLLVTDIQSNVDLVDKLVQQLDSAESSAVDVISLDHISAGEAVHIASQMKQFQQQGLSLVEDSLNNRVIVDGPERVRAAFKDLLRSLDVPSTKEGGIEVIYLDYARAEDIKTVIEGMLDSEMFLRLAGEGGAAAGQDKASTGYKIEVDVPNNAIIIAASSSVIRELRKVVEKLDLSRPQVLIEAVIAELSEDQAKRLSVQLAYASKGHGGYLTQFDDLLVSLLGLGADGDFSDSDVTAIGNLVGGTANTYAAAGDFDRNTGKGMGVLIQALKSDNHTKVLSTPSVVTLDNEEATLSVGQEVPFITGSFTSSNDGASNPFQTINREEVGIKLVVKPQISKGDAVRLELDQESSKLLGSSSQLGTADVVTSKSTIKTNVLVQDGELLILGGLIDDQYDSSETKVPILGDIPILGHLFRSSSKGKGQSVQMMFIRPTILRDPARASEISKNRFDHLITRDRDLESDRSLKAMLERFQNDGQRDQSAPEQQDSRDSVAPE